MNHEHLIFLNIPGAETVEETKGRPICSTVIDNFILALF